MRVEISEETYHVLQHRVELGHYDSVQEALVGSVHQAAALTSKHHDDDYLAYVNERIEAGLADVAAGRVRPAEEVLAELRSLRSR